MPTLSFIAYVDLKLGEQTGLVAAFVRSFRKGLNPFQVFCEKFRSAPQVTIVKLAGVACGGGSE